MTDNGGEFSSDEMREVVSILNVRLVTTAAESPFQNGLCERVHLVTDMMLLTLIEENKKTESQTLLSWEIWHETLYKCGMVSVAIN